MGENKYMIMDETIRPFEPGETGYELLLKLEPKLREIDKKILTDMGLSEEDLIKPIEYDR